MSVGDLVRIPYEYPRDVITNKRLTGKFRAGDIRYDPKPRKVEQVIIGPNSIVLYRVEGVRNAVYQKTELQLVKPGDTIPVRRAPPNEDLFEIESLRDPVIIAGVKSYNVRWKGYDESENTNEPRDKLLQEVPQMVRNYERKNKVNWTARSYEWKGRKLRIRSLS